MLYGETQLLFDDESSGSSMVYSKNVAARDFSKRMVYFKENGYSDVEIKIEGRISRKNVSSWTDILGTTLLPSGDTVLITSASLTGATQAELLDEVWEEIRVGIKNSGGTGQVKCVIAQRRR